MTIIVAELGINHNGDINNIFKMIDELDKAGVDYVKFQTRDPEVAVPKDQWDVRRVPPWGGDAIRYIDYKKRMELTNDDYNAISMYILSYCVSIKGWFTSVWDENSLERIVSSYNPEFIKIPSAKITDLNLVSASVKTGTDIIMSTGMSTAEEVSDAVDILLNSQFKGQRIFLLSTVSVYPAHDNEVNLNRLSTLKRVYSRPNVFIGYSNHHPSPYPVIYSAVLGAEMVEFHYTFDRAAPGTDHSASLEYKGAELLVREIKRIPNLLGSGAFEPLPREIPVRRKLRG